MSANLEHTVIAFLEAEEARDRDRRALRKALEMAYDNADNDGAKRLKRWALERYNG